MGESAYIVGCDTPNSNLDAWMIMVNADDLIIFTSVINETTGSLSVMGRERVPATDSGH